MLALGCSKPAEQEAAASTQTATAQKPPREPGAPIALESPCPSPVVLDCERVIPEALRNTFLAGRKLTKNEVGECSVGQEGFGVSIGVAAATPASVRALQTSSNPVPGLGRVAASGIRSRVVFLASAVDCEISVEVTNRLDRGTRFARAIDQVFTADNVAPR